MKKKIGIVRETKNQWERRVPLTPSDVKAALQELPVSIYIQPSDLRVFPEGLYTKAGATVGEDLSGCDMIFGIKEVKIDDLLPGKVYSYFSHTVKGQSYNMEMLQKLLDLKCTLIDYERIANNKGQRLIYFSLHAGLAGIVETMWALGQQMKIRGVETPLLRLKQTYNYGSLKEIKAEFEEVAKEIRKSGLPAELKPLVIGITGYGNVARGVHELLDILPVKEIQPSELSEIAGSGDNKHVYKVVFKEADMVQPADPDRKFVLQDYYDNPEKYESIFDQYLPYLTVLVNASFWDTQYPRHVTIDGLKKLFQQGKSRTLKTIGDISCDIDGGVECTIKATDPGEPVFTFNPVTNTYTDGFLPEGIVIMSVDNLPSELPRDASEYFSGVLKTLLPDMVRADFNAPFEKLVISNDIKKAIIVYQGKLTPDYNYLQDYLG